MRRPRGLVVFLIAVAAVTVAAFAHRGVDTRGAKVESYTIHSRLVGTDLRQIGIRTGSHRPLVVLLHGRGSGPESWIRPQLFDALLSEIKAFAATTGFEDDMCLVGMEIRRVPGARS